MKKKVLVTLLVIALALVSVSAKDLGIKVGGELGWGIQTGSAKFDSDKYEITTVKESNNGFALNLTGEYAFDKNWSVKADMGLMFAGKANVSIESASRTAEKASGAYFDFAVDGKYTYAINKQFSVSGLAGIEMIYGYLAKFGTSDDEDNKNFGMGVNFGVEGGYNLDDKITITAGFDFSWLFINSNKEINDMAKKTKDAGGKVTIVNLYMRPYVGATYAF